VTLAVAATPDELIVRNLLSTKRIPKGQIEGFRIASRSARDLRKTIVVLLLDDSMLDLTVTSRPALLSTGQRKLQTQLEELRHWLQP
jgi:phage head maturation protease